MSAAADDAVAEMTPAELRDYIEELIEEKEAAEKEADEANEYCFRVDQEVAGVRESKTALAAHVRTLCDLIDGSRGEGVETRDALAHLENHGL